MTSSAHYTAERIDRCNATGRTPVVSIHRLWLLPSNWERWDTVFADAGYTPPTPGWPDDLNTIAEANAQPEVFASAAGFTRRITPAIDRIYPLAETPAAIRRLLDGQARGKLVISVSPSSAPSPDPGSTP